MQIKNILHQTYITPKGDGKSLTTKRAETIAGPVKQDNSRKCVFSEPYVGPTEKVRNASDARRQGEAVYEYREPRATKQMMYFWLTKTFRVCNIICTGIEKIGLKTLHLNRFKQLLNSLQ